MGDGILGTFLDLWNRVRPENNDASIAQPNQEDYEDQRCEAVLEDYRYDRFFDKYGGYGRRNDEEASRCFERQAKKFRARDAQEPTSDSNDNIFLHLGDGVSAAGRGLLWLASKPQELWNSLTPEHQNMLKFAGLFVLARAGLWGTRASENEFRSSKRDDSLRGTFKFRGKEYDVVAYADGRLSINGQVWKVEGTKAETKVASIKIDKMDYNPNSETLSVKIKGTIALVSKYFEREVGGDKLAELLETLTTSDRTIETPEMKATGIRLVPSARV